jgi:cation transporter-like permease
VVGNRGSAAYLTGMAQPRTKLGNLATIALVGVPLFAILAVSGWYAAKAWVSVSGPPMPATGYVAMTLGVVFSVVVGCGLMALLFYSNRHGYDDAAQGGDQHDG